MKANRSRMPANDKRRSEAAVKQYPLPVAEQQRRAAERERAYRWKYPKPPNYESKDRAER